MTLRSAVPAAEAAGIVKFPDPPPEEMTAYHHVLFPGYPGALALHFGKPESTVILSEIAAALIPTESYEGVRYPDLLIAFDANPAAIMPRNGYLIPEQGKPPDFVMEVASESTGRIDENRKRLDYSRMRIPEYWRFDYTGGSYHITHLAGDRLVGDEYRPIPIHQTEEGHYWGHSNILNLDLCWENGELRWYDPVARRYLPNFREKDAQLRAADAARETAESQRETAESQREAADAAREVADAAREVAESQREAADAAREAAESQREAADAAREAAESRREAADAAREAAESRREAADAAREAAESRVRELVEKLRRQQGSGPPEAP